MKELVDIWNAAIVGFIVGYFLRDLRALVVEIVNLLKVVAASPRRVPGNGDAAMESAPAGDPSGEPADGADDDGHGGDAARNG